jgi:predicted transcriptional regulator
MNDLALAELETVMTTGYPDFAAMTNDELICTVMGNDIATAVELELAERLDRAVSEIDQLVKELGHAGQVQH